MAKKKYKNIKLEQESLKPITIGMFESRKKTSIGVFLVLLIFILAVIFLPEISAYLDSYLNPAVEPSASNEPSKPTVPINPEEEEEKEDNTSYSYQDGLKIDKDDISVGDFVLDTVNFTLSYTVTNNLSTNQNLEDLNYYLEIYNSEQTLLERVKLTDQATIASGAFLKYTRNISEVSATSIANVILIKKTTDDYPLVTLGSSEDNTGSLVCSNGYEKVTYKFEEDKLKEVTSLVNYVNTELNYQTIYQNYKVLSDGYNNKTGIVSTWIDYDGGFSVTTTVDLSKANREYIFSADSFKLDTEAKVVKFEIEAQGFSCE